MNPEKNRFEPLHTEETASQKINRLKQEFSAAQSILLRPDGTPVPEHWTQFRLDELVEIKGYTFRVRYIGETSILFEPVGPILLEEKT